MCVLTYIPLKNGEISITHNRDEHIFRPKAILPQTYSINGRDVIFPKDPQGGGTWFGIHQEWVCCLLNGGFVNHTRKQNYSRSRGTIITDFFQNPDIQDFINRFDSHEIEPFTLLIFNIETKQIVQFVWDENILNIQHLDASKAHIWSSSTLYDSKVKANRALIFKQFIAAQPNVNQIMDFHRLNIDNNPQNGFFVNLEETIKTVAITQVSGKTNALKMVYKDFYQ